MISGISIENIRIFMKRDFLSTSQFKEENSPDLCNNVMVPFSGNRRYTSYCHSKIVFPVTTINKEIDIKYM